MFKLGKGSNKVFHLRKDKKHKLYLSFVNFFALSFLMLFPKPAGLGLEHYEI